MTGVDEFELDEDERGFSLSWTVAEQRAAAKADASVGSATEKRKKKHRKLVRHRVALRIARHDAVRCIDLVRVVLRHAADQKARRRKFVTRGALLDELLLHHRELARVEAR